MGQHPRASGILLTINLDVAVIHYTLANRKLACKQLNVDLQKEVLYACLHVVQLASCR